jgi:hypothetical protein
MKSLLRTPAWASLSRHLNDERARRRKELETVTETATEMYRNQGRIEALSWVLNLPEQLYKQAGGEGEIDQ